MDAFDWQHQYATLAEENIRLLTRQGYREQIETSPNLDSLVKALDNIFTKEGIPTSSVGLVRALAPPNGSPEFVQLLSANGTYEPNTGDIFDSEKSLTGLAIAINQPQYAPAVSVHPRIILPEKISGDASEFAYPIKYDSEAQKFRGALLLRREKISGFTPQDRERITNIMNDLQSQLGIRVGINEARYDGKCKTILSPTHLPYALAQDYEGAVRDKNSYAVTFIDLDDFKLLNSNYGHLKTDDILYVTGEIFRESIRDNDIVGRHGGDEFVIGLRHISQELLEQRILALREQLHKMGTHTLAQRMDIDPHIDLSFSAGVAYFSPPHDRSSKFSSPTIYQLLDVADDAVYRAKEKGKQNTVVTLVQTG